MYMCVSEPMKPVKANYENCTINIRQRSMLGERVTPNMGFCKTVKLEYRFIITVIFTRKIFCYYCGQYCEV